MVSKEVVLGGEQRSLVLVALGGAAVVALLIGLVVQVRKPPPEVDAARLAEASARHRAARPAAASPSRPSTASSSSSAPSVTIKPDDEHPAEGRPAPTRPFSTAPAGLAPMGLAAAEPQPAADRALRQRAATAAYDRGDYAAAADEARAVLADDPTNVRMLRVAASSECVLGEADQAKVHFDRLPERDQKDIRKRCAKYGIEF